MRRYSSRRLSTRLCLIALLSIGQLFISGCKTTIRYNLNPVKDYEYEVTALKGDLKNEKAVFNGMPMTMLIKMKPVMKTSAGGVDAGVIIFSKLLRNEAKTIYGDKNIGEVKLKINASGKILETLGGERPSEVEDFFFEVPSHGMSKGESWPLVRYHVVEFVWLGHMFQYNAPVEYRYSFTGTVRRGGEKCALLKFTGSHVKSNDFDTPDGTKTIKVSFDRTGEIFFSLKKGRVLEAVYDQIIKYEGIDTFTGEVQIRVNDVTQVTYRLKKS